MKQLFQLRVRQRIAGSRECGRRTGAAERYTERGQVRVPVFLFADETTGTSAGSAPEFCNATSCLDPREACRPLLVIAYRNDTCWVHCVLAAPGCDCRHCRRTRSTSAWGSSSAGPLLGNLSLLRESGSSIPVMSAVSAWPIARQTRRGPKGAAAKLGLKRTTLIHKMQKPGISRSGQQRFPNRIRLGPQEPDSLSRVQ
jgi:hypothetical protein